MKKIFILCLALTLTVFTVKGICADTDVKIKQLTTDAKNHGLGIFDAWSGDDEWIVYACGPNHLNDLIEKVSTKTGEIVTLYKIDNQTEYGPGCGTPSYCPTQDKVVFIHGPRNFGPDQKYEFWRRSAAVIREPDYNRPVFIDARDVTLPFTPGALRGGTHCHEWSHDGEWVAFTYNDMIMAELEKKTGRTLDLRTIGVSANLKPVDVDEDPAGENFDGEWFSVLLVDVVPYPEPGSDEISRAYENCWVGYEGYTDRNGKTQRAVAFKGKVADKTGREVPEVFIVDIPDDIKADSSAHPLEGTANKMPSPPLGTKWRRLTYTADRKYPGLSVDPRFWLRTSPKGDKIFFLARDDNGINQIYYVLSLGGPIVQVTSQATDVMSTPSISSDGGRICYICEGCIYVTEISGMRTFRVTNPAEKPVSSPIWSNNGDRIAFNRAVESSGGTFLQIFITEPL
jgi:hypothetical protein